jgi:hypothetical protein
MLRKLFIVIECDDDKQRDNVQAIFNELSNTRVLTADKILKAYPMYKAREADIRQLFAIVSNNGVKGLMSVQGATLLTNILRR